MSEDSIKKKPVIRKGQKKPFIKGTNQQVEERIEYTATLVAKLYTKTEIHKAITEKYNLDWRTSDRYIGRAKLYLAKQAQMTSDAAKEVGVGVLLDVMRNGKASERVAAARLWTDIFGLAAPVKTEQKVEMTEVIVKHANEA